MPNSSPFIGGSAHKFRVRCPDCSRLDGDHTKGCMWKAVQDGKLTPRERQVAIVERQMALGIVTTPISSSMAFDQAFRFAIRSGCAQVRDSVIRVHSADLERLMKTAQIPSNGTAGSPSSPLRIEGVKIIRDDTVQEGFLVAVPAKVESLIESAPAGMNTQVGVTPENDHKVIAGFDPAMSDPIRRGVPVFSMRDSNGVYRAITGFAS